MFDVRWERPLHQAGSPCALAATAHHLVVHERSTRVVALDPADGSVRWDVPVGTWPRNLVIEDRFCLVIPQNVRRLLCLDVGTGEDVWQREPGAFAGHVVAHEGLVLVGGWRGYTPLSAVDLRTGDLRWRAKDRRRTALPVATAAGFLVGEPGGESVRLIDRADGRELAEWSFPGPLLGPDAGSAFVPDGSGGVLMRCGDRSVVRIRSSERKAETLFRAEHDLIPRAVERCGGLLWLAHLRGGCTAVDESDGTVRWRIDHDRRFVPSVAPVDGGFAIADEGGTLFRIDHEGAVRERVRITQRIRDLRGQAPSRLVLLTKGTLLAMGNGVLDDH
ncbi:outer membrane protein assembly factor BamB family protein [Amycolatopsis thailandensis]|uniref:outer membrane protein assembly factor BamB family protein n=1 Tax=Amycolatopsis thailandensis TaxID=589330 RepID=UPI0036317F3D